jgi:putative DNA primase/helicase
MEPREYCELFFGPLSPDDNITLSWLVGKRCRSKRFKRKDLDAFVEKALKLGEQHNTFYSCAPTNLPLENTARGSNEQVTAMLAFHFDIDLLSLAAHVKRELPESEEEIKAFVNEVLPKPTAIIFSGHGVHLIYILAVPICITDEASRRRAIELQQAFFRYVSTKASERGWKIDNCSDLARMLRFPGTMNLKDREHPVRCEIREMDGHLYTLEELKPYLVFADAKEAPQASPVPQKGEKAYPDALEASRISNSRPNYN